MEVGFVVDMGLIWLTRDVKCESDRSGGTDTGFAVHRFSAHSELELDVSSTEFNAL